MERGRRNRGRDRGRQDAGFTRIQKVPAASVAQAVVFAKDFELGNCSVVEASPS